MGESSVSRCTVVSAVVALVATPLSAATIEVASGESIQAAIDHPETNPGDTIVVAPGVYYETIDFHGRALTVRSQDPTDTTVVAKTVIDGNGDGTVITFQQGEDRDSVLSGFTIRGGFGTSGGGMYIDSSRPTVTWCTFIENEAMFDGGGMFCGFGDPVVTNCRFVGNTAIYGGGVAALLADAEFGNCVFVGNSAVQTGGAVDVFTGGAPLFAGCAMTGNSADRGGGVSNDGGEGVFVNTILWDNTAETSAEMRQVGSSVMSFTHSLVGDSGGSAAWDDALGTDGGGNLDANPRFVDALGPDALAGTLDDDLQLGPDSPCVDAGTNDGIPQDAGDVDDDDDRAEPLPLDLLGRPRRVDRADVTDSGAGDAPLVDMGPFELEASSTCTWDLNGDGRVNGRDLSILLGRPDFQFVELIELIMSWGPCERDTIKPRWRCKKVRRIRRHRRHWR